MSACTPARKREPRRRDPTSRPGQEPRRALQRRPRPSRHRRGPLPTRQTRPQGRGRRSCLGPCCPQAWTFLRAEPYSPASRTAAARSHRAPSSEGQEAAGTRRGVAALELEPRSDSRTQRRRPSHVSHQFKSLFGINSKPLNICSTHISTPQVLRGDGRSKRGTDIQGRNGTAWSNSQTSHVHM